MNNLFKKKLPIFIASLLFAGSANANVLDKVKKQDVLVCGVSEGVPGFSNPDSNGKWVGLDVDICRAIAAAALGDSGKVRYVPLSSKQKVLAVTSGQVDITSRTTTWTMKRDTKEGADFTTPVFYDGQGFMVRKEPGITSVKEMDGATICVTAGTTTELNLSDFARANGLTFESVVFEGKKEVFSAYESGRCDAITTDSSQLAAFRSSMKKPNEHLILPEIISKEPLAPLVAHGDNQWKDTVTWIIFGLINAEEMGITSANVKELAKNSKNPEIQRMLGKSGEVGSYIGLSNDWLVHAISSVGNYGEIYKRNLTNTLGLDRGYNALWRDGGILYAPPIR